MPPLKPTSYDSLATPSLSLLQRAVLQDAAAWQRLNHFCSLLVLRKCRHAGLQEADRGDVVQEVLQAVARHLKDFRRDLPGQSFRAWLRTIAKNKIIDHFRRLQREPGGAGGTTALEQLHALSDGELSQDSETEKQSEDVLLMAEAMRIAENDFEPQSWLAFRRCVLDCLEAPLVAQELGMSPAAVRKAKSRVMARMREVLGELME
jgi:RNA polymerase sigma-70 factor, ECF subfamily